MNILREEVLQEDEQGKVVKLVLTDEARELLTVPGKVWLFSSKSEHAPIYLYIAGVVSGIIIVCGILILLSILYVL